MHEIAIEQARLRRDDGAPPYWHACSPGFRDEWRPEVERLVTGFGPRRQGTDCPLAIFAQPLGVMHVAVVQVTDHGGPRSLSFHVLVCYRPDYEHLLGDPFALARLLPAQWNDVGHLPTLSLPRQSLPPRTVRQVQAVLQRVKAGALMEGEDPEHPDFERTPSNSESPALLGGVQALVEGGKLAFERPAPDSELVEGLWTLLPQSTRARLWPASFALGNALRFDVVVVPRLDGNAFDGYLTEDQAAEYPAGRYELALQVAAEAGNEHELDALLNRRSSRDTFKLGWALLAMVILLLLAPRVLLLLEPAGNVNISKTAAATGMVASGNPWTACALKLYGDMKWSKR